jgi:hypothetical protein
VVAGKTINDTRSGECIGRDTSMKCPGRSPLNRLVPAVQVHGLLRCMLGMFAGVQPMAMGNMGMMTCLPVIAGLGMLCRFAMMFRSSIEMLGRFFVMVVNFVLVAHGNLQCLQRGSIHRRTELYPR